MYDYSPPTLETFSHWPSWLNARGHLDRSACFELKVSDIRRLAGCIPMGTSQRGKAIRLRRRERFNVPDLPNERKARNGKGRISSGYYDLSAYQINALALLQIPRSLGGDWRTGRAPAMRPERSNLPSMALDLGGYGPGSYGYEQKQAVSHGNVCADAMDTKVNAALDAGLDGNPNRGSSREKKFGLDVWWMQRVSLEKWEHNSVSGVQYFLICPGCEEDPHGVGCAKAVGLTEKGLRSTVDAKGLKGLTGTTSNCGDGSKGAHDKGWVCGQRAYKLFWVMAREAEVRDALLAEEWIGRLDSGQLARQSAAVSALIDRYGPIMGDDRLLRCRRCLRLRYGQSPEVLRKKRRRGAERLQAAYEKPCVMQGLERVQEEERRVACQGEASTGPGGLSDIRLIASLGLSATRLLLQLARTRARARD